MPIEFNIRMGIPEMALYWERMKAADDAGTLPEEARSEWERFKKALRLLKMNPRYPGLSSHDIDVLSQRYGVKVYQSYLENATPGAGRIFWVYGPDKGDLTIIGMEPHPEKSDRAYKRITLSSPSSATPKPNEVKKAKTARKSKKPTKRE